ncbi:MAG: VOC family protein [Bacteroidales bacterium]|nr:VOC family protein [Bacteroidales bacterium]
MKIEHIALTVSDVEEVKNFYTDILEMEELKNFVLNKELSQKIFNTPEDTSAFFMQKNDLFLELFICNEKLKQGFNHTCISVNDREAIVKKAESRDYECIKIKREFSNLIFIKDKSGNIFEVKEK